MNKQQEEIREQQKQSWNKFSGGWKKWNEQNATYSVTKPNDSKTHLV